MLSFLFLPHSKFPHADVAVGFLTCLVVVVLMIFLSLPKVLCGAQGGINFISLTT